MWICTYEVYRICTKTITMYKQYKKTKTQETKRKPKTKMQSKGKKGKKKEDRKGGQPSVLVRAPVPPLSLRHGTKYTNLPYCSRALRSTAGISHLLYPLGPFWTSRLAHQSAKPSTAVSCFGGLVDWVIRLWDTRITTRIKFLLSQHHPRSYPITSTWILCTSSDTT